MISGGILGPIKAYFGTVESQGRGSLHLHMLIWLDHDMRPADLKENIQDDHFREKLKAYLEDIIKEDLDDFKEKQAFEGLSEQLLIFLIRSSTSLRMCSSTTTIHYSSSSIAG